MSNRINLKFVYINCGARFLLDRWKKTLPINSFFKLFTTSKLQTSLKTFYKNLIVFYRGGVCEMVLLLPNGL
jgi:hypothetical protein